MYLNNKTKGDLGEKIAEDYLKKLGYIILEKNFRTKIGEIDIIGKDGQYVVFIEVKTRHNNIYGTPGEAVNLSKQHKIIRTSQLYILKRNLSKYDFRFDVIEIILNNTNENTSINLIKNAFQL